MDGWEATSCHLNDTETVLNVVKTYDLTLVGPVVQAADALLTADSRNGVWGREHSVLNDLLRQIKISDQER